MKEHYLSILRDKETNTSEFRSAANSLAIIIAGEVSAKIPLKPINIKTPLAHSHGSTLEHRIILIPILRSGLALLSPFLNLFPASPIGFLGIRRDEKDAHAIPYYEHIPPLRQTDQIFLLDPMLATGGSALCALSTLEKNGANLAQITLVTFIASETGINQVKKQNPEIQIYSAAIDPILDSHWLIVPGLGDFGDRYYSS